MTADPVRYTPAIETPEENEGRTSQELRDNLHQILEITSKDYGHAVRSVHAKSHGIVHGTLTVRDDLPPEYAQGMFASPGRYDAIGRISTNPGDILDDSISVPRGFALKAIGVEGERLPGSKETGTQDFVMANGPVFAAASAKDFLANLKLLAKTTDRAQWAKKALSAVLRGAEAGLETLGGESTFLKTMGGAPNTHPLGETYYSQTAYRYGDHIAKFALVPVSPALVEQIGETVSARGRPDALREEVDKVLNAHGGTWELRVQLCRDLATMPVEDPTVRWDEEASPFVTVAELSVPAQSGWNGDASVAEEDRLSFAPWHGLVAHRPLGAINRVRQPAYDMSAEFRAEFNGCPVHHPQTVMTPA